MEAGGKRPSWRGFLDGGLASCGAEVATMPLDVLKVRMQLQGQPGFLAANPITTAATMLREEGIFVFWRGTSPAILRQATYGTLRIGLYSRAKAYIGIEEGSAKADPLRKMSAGVISGSAAAAICNPTDLIKVRMQSGIHRGQNRYRGILHAVSTIAKEEGLRAFYRGVGPTTSRAAVVAAAELGSYDEIKAYFRRRGASDDIKLHFGTAALAGLCATSASSPFDVVKSRVMSQPVDAMGRGLRYKGMIDCFKKSLQAEGISFMWRGFTANYLNKGPTVVLFFILYEAIQRNLDALL
ncbi:hypothetical protein AAMO2058_001282500 [Amorphochlora amoebiformis]